MKHSLLATLSSLLLELQLGAPEEIILERLIDVIYEHKKSKTLEIFLHIQELERRAKEAELQKMYTGLETSLHAFSSLSRHLLEDKTSAQAKSTAKYYAASDNIATLIMICKAYFHNGEYGGASLNGRWILDSLINMLRKNKSKYLEGGDSYQWVLNNDHKEYIDMLIEKHNI